MAIVRFGPRSRSPAVPRANGSEVRARRAQGAARSGAGSRRPVPRRFAANCSHGSRQVAARCRLLGQGFRSRASAGVCDLGHAVPICPGCSRSGRPIGSPPGREPGITQSASVPSPAARRRHHQSDRLRHWPARVHTARRRVWGNPWQFAAYAGDLDVFADVPGGERDHAGVAGFRKDWPGGPPLPSGSRTAR